MSSRQYRCRATQSEQRRWSGCPDSNSRPHSAQSRSHGPFRPRQKRDEETQVEQRAWFGFSASKACPHSAHTFGNGPSRRRAEIVEAFFRRQRRVAALEHSRHHELRPSRERPFGGNSSSSRTMQQWRHSSTSAGFPRGKGQRGWVDDPQAVPTPPPGSQLPEPVGGRIDLASG